MSRDRYPELSDLADPTAMQTALTVSYDKTIEDTRKEVIKIVTISGHSGTLDDPRLQDHTALLHKRNMYLLDIGTKINLESARHVQLTKSFECKETIA